MGKAKGEGSRAETEAHHLGGGAQADRCGTASTGGKGKERRLKEKTVPASNWYVLAALCQPQVE
jgi:hypothetical protein